MTLGIITHFEFYHFPKIKNNEIFYQKYERPPNVFTIQSSSGLQTFNKDLLHTNTKSATLPRNMLSKVTSNHYNSTQRTSDSVSSTSHNHTTKNGSGMKHKQSPTSTGCSKGENIIERVNHLQHSTAKAAIRVANKSPLNQEPGIVDGYLENVLTKKNIIFFCRTP